MSTSSCVWATPFDARRGVEPSRARACSCHFEAVGFDGAPRFLGIDEQGREILLRRGRRGARAATGFRRGSRRARTAASTHARGGRGLRGARRRGVVHRGRRAVDLPPRPVPAERDPSRRNPGALIDWDLAGPAEPLDDVVSAASHWAPLRTDAEKWGLPDDSAARTRADALRRLRAVGDRASALHRPCRPASTRRLRAAQAAGRRANDGRVGGRCGTRAAERRVKGNLRLLEELRPELEAALA